MEHIQKPEMNYLRGDLKVVVEKQKLLLTIKEKTYSFDLNKISKRLAAATEDEQKHFRISPSGYGIHWYLVDEDISIPSLLNEPKVGYVKKSK